MEFVRQPAVESGPSVNHRRDDLPLIAELAADFVGLIGKPERIDLPSHGLGGDTEARRHGALVVGLLEVLRAKRAVGDHLRDLANVFKHERRVDDIAAGNFDSCNFVAAVPGLRDGQEIERGRRHRHFGCDHG